MTQENDWLVGEYFVYAFDDVDGKIFEHPASITRPDGKKFIVHWNFGPDFEYQGEISFEGGYIYASSKRINNEEFVLAIFPIPENKHMNFVWGIAVGTVPRGNLPAIFKVIFTRKQLSMEEAGKEFADMGLTAENSISVVDYDIEEKNQRKWPL